MYAYKEILTLDDPQHLTLSKPLPFLKGKKVEVLVIVEEDNEEEFFIDNKACLEALEELRQGSPSHVTEIGNISDYIDRLKNEIDQN
jgi:hypothetical protein